MISRSSKGATLIEVMIASSLMLLITGACAMALRASTQYLRRVEAQSTMESQMMRVIGMLTNDIAETSVASLVAGSTPPSLTLASPRDTTGVLQIDHVSEDTFLFSSLFHYSLNPATKDLRRYAEALAVPSSRAPHPLMGLLPPRDNNYFSSSALPYLTLAKGVEIFNIEGYDLDRTSSAETLVANLVNAKFLRVHIKMERQFDKLYGIETRIDLSPKN